MKTAAWVVLILGGFGGDLTGSEGESPLRDQVSEAEVIVTGSLIGEIRCIGMVRQGEVYERPYGIGRFQVDRVLKGGDRQRPGAVLFLAGPMEYDPREIRAETPHPVLLRSLLSQPVVLFLKRPSSQAPTESIDAQIRALATKALPPLGRELPMEEVEAWVRQLGDPDFEKREEAERRLSECGDGQKAFLEKKRKVTEDPEITSRLDRLLSDFPWKGVTAGDIWKRVTESHQGFRRVSEPLLEEIKSLLESGNK